MRKIKILLVILVVVIALLLVLGVFLQGKGIAVGRAVKGENGETLWINESGIPTIMNGRFPGMFFNLKTGDHILIVHSRQMAMSYPGQVGVYLCLKIGNGSVTDLSEQTIEELNNMGYDLTD